VEPKEEGRWGKRSVAELGGTECNVVEPKEEGSMRMRNEA
jgi:hypothetical protein